MLCSFRVHVLPVWLLDLIGACLHPSFSLVHPYPHMLFHAACLHTHSRPTTTHTQVRVCFKRLTRHLQSQLLDLDPLGLTLALRHLAALGAADSGCQVGGGLGSIGGGSGRGATLRGGGLRGD